MRRLLLSLCFVGLAATAHAAVERKPFSHYESIVSRSPFGALQTIAVAPTGPTAAERAAAAAARKPVDTTPPPWISSLQLCAIIKEDDAPLRVGLFDKQLKQSYWIREGEANEYLVVEVDYDAERTLIEKDGRRYWFSTEGPPYEEGRDPAPVTLSRATPAAAPAAQRRRTRVTASKPALTKEEYMKIKHQLPPPTQTVTPALARARAEGTAPPANSTPSELRRYLQEHQMELIRAQGAKGPALPMPLTPEMDAQLVAEGVLPAP